MHAVLIPKVLTFQHWTLFSHIIWKHFKYFIAYYFIWAYCLRNWMPYIICRYLGKQEGSFTSLKTIGNGGCELPGIGCRTWTCLNSLQEQQALLTSEPSHQLLKIQWNGTVSQYLDRHSYLLFLLFCIFLIFDISSTIAINFFGHEFMFAYLSSYEKLLRIELRWGTNFLNL